MSYDKRPKTQGKERLSLGKDIFLHFWRMSVTVNKHVKASIGSVFDEGIKLAGILHFGELLYYELLLVGGACVCVRAFHQSPMHVI